MARLSKREVAAHREAEQLLKLERLNDDQRQFVLDNWNEGARHMNSAAGAFFTPSALALDAALMGGCNICSDVEQFRVIDLCAGIGTLGLAAWWRTNKRAQVTCVEINPDYCEVGRKLFPEAQWICADVNALPSWLGRFDVALANPPFGKVAKIKGPRYSGESDLAVIDIASGLARMGCFIMPTGSLPFSFSGRQYYERRENERYERFRKATGIELECESIDCAFYAEGWRGVRPNVEVVTCDFEPVVEARKVSPLIEIEQPKPVEIAPLPLVAATRPKPAQLVLF
jgi:predicted RNA methylase